MIQVHNCQIIHCCRPPASGNLKKYQYFLVTQFLLIFRLFGLRQELWSQINCSVFEWSQLLIKTYKTSELILKWLKIGYCENILLFFFLMPIYLNFPWCLFYFYYFKNEFFYTKIREECLFVFLFAVWKFQLNFLGFFSAISVSPFKKNCTNFIKFSVDKRSSPVTETEKFFVLKWVQTKGWRRKFGILQSKSWVGFCLTFIWS